VYYGGHTVSAYLPVATTYLQNKFLPMKRLLFLFFVCLSANANAQFRHPTKAETMTMTLEFYTEPAFLDTFKIYFPWFSPKSDTLLIIEHNPKIKSNWGVTKQSLCVVWDKKNKTLSKPKPLKCFYFKNKTMEDIDKQYDALLIQPDYKQIRMNYVTYPYRCLHPSTCQFEVEKNVYKTMVQIDPVHLLLKIIYDTKLKKYVLVEYDREQAFFASCSPKKQDHRHRIAHYFK
jgi:hypothetical protein